MPPTPRRVREPVQAWLEPADADLLDELASRSELSKAEVIRQAIRRMARDIEVTHRPGAAFGALAGALDAVDGVPPDLAANHDEYLYGDRTERTSKARRR